MLLGVAHAGADNRWGASPLDVVGLPNAFRVHPNVITGGVPDGDAGFDQLQQLGVKTIISVDGARPQIESAKRHGLRYVHLPHGYGGISDSHKAQLAKAILALPSPFYIHCHHGKHRSPAATMVACISAGLIQPDHAVEFLELAGTNKKYAGLYAAVRECRPIEKSELRRIDPKFPEVAEVPPLAKLMVEIERRFDNLLSADRDGWQLSEQSPKLSPAHDALMLREHFAELLRKSQSDETDSGMQRLLKHSLEATTKIEILVDQRTLDQDTVAELRKVLSSVKADCRKCHATYRDDLGSSPNTR